MTTVKRATIFLLFFALGCNHSDPSLDSVQAKNAFIGNWQFLYHTSTDFEYSELKVDSNYFKLFNSEWLLLQSYYIIKSDSLFNYSGDTLHFYSKIIILNDTSLVLKRSDTSDTLQRISNKDLVELNNDDFENGIWSDFDKRKEDYYIQKGFITQAELERNKKMAKESAITIYDDTTTVIPTKEN